MSGDISQQINIYGSSTINGSVHYSTELINTIEQLAYKLMLPKDIAKIIEVDERQFIKDLQKPNHPAAQAFNRGMLKKDVETQDLMNDITDAFLLEWHRKRIQDFKAKLIIQFHG